MGVELVFEGRRGLDGGEVLEIDGVWDCGWEVGAKAWRGGFARSLYNLASAS